MFLRVDAFKFFASFESHVIVSFHEGSLPGFESVEPADEAVQEALAAMELDEDGSSRLNYFIQVFRSGDYPVYEDYAVHRNAEGSPFQIIVTK